MSEGSTWTRIPMAAGIGLLVGLIAGGAGAGYVWWQGQQELQAAQTRFDELEASSAQALEEHTKAMEAALQEKVDRTVRIELARALGELDRRNFGSAQDRLQAARKALADASEAVQEAGKGLANVDLQVTDETGAQRDTLQSIIKEVDGALK